jgi:hypothetical protein
MIFLIVPVSVSLAVGAAASFDPVSFLMSEMPTDEQIDFIEWGAESVKEEQRVGVSTRRATRQQETSPSPAGTVPPSSTTHYRLAVISMLARSVKSTPSDMYEYYKSIHPDAPTEGFLQITALRKLYLAMTVQPDWVHLLLFHHQGEYTEEVMAAFRNRARQMAGKRVVLFSTEKSTDMILNVWLHYCILPLKRDPSTQPCVEFINRGERSWRLSSTTRLKYFQDELTRLHSKRS